MTLQCPVCRKPATHEVEWGDGSTRVYCEAHATLAMQSPLPTVMRRLSV